MSGLEGKSALVSGGSRGIGLAITRTLLDRGAQVFICATTQSGVDRAVTALAERDMEAASAGLCATCATTSRFAA